MYRVEVGRSRGVQPGNLVGAIANEIGLDGRRIGRIEIHEEHSLVELPATLPRRLLKQLQSVRVGGLPLRISEAPDAPATGAGRPRRRPAG